MVRLQVLPPTSGSYGNNWLARTFGDNSYATRFDKDQLPAQFATHFWSVIAVDSVEHRVLPNPQKRYLINRETKPHYASDGSLTLYFSDARPADASQGNWLPTSKGARYSLTFASIVRRAPLRSGPTSHRRS